MSRTRSLSKLIGPSGSQASVKATSFVGDASSLTGLPAGYADSDVATYLLSNGISNIVSAASDPSVGSAGKVYFNTTLGLLKVSDGTAWVKVSAELAVLSSISGSIFTTIASNITLTGTGFLSDSCIVTFTVGATDYTVTKTADSNNTISAVAVPSAVYNSAAGTSVSITVTNIDSSTSEAVSTTIIGLPAGGTITTSGSYRIHTFTSSGTFAVPSGFSATADYLIVAGGGGGGGSYHAGGGGAGGYRTSAGTSGGGGGAESSLNITAQSYSITVGAGGAGGAAYTADSRGINGSNSVFSSIISIGGGGGGAGGDNNGSASNRTGLSGGSGGGEGSYSGDGGNGGGSGTSGQGFAGGASGGGGPNYGAGGGGGSSAVGVNATTTSGGNGGAGTSSSITGSAVTRAGGGGGAAYNSTTASGTGSAGGGNGSNGQGTAGSINTGSGGGGSERQPTNYIGGAGGSGIVIIRYTI